MSKVDASPSVERSGPSPMAPPASSPCLLHELLPDGAVGVDPEQARDVARWRIFLIRLTARRSLRPCSLYHWSASIPSATGSATEAGFSTAPWLLSKRLAL
jgi:hypothetical protein